MAGERHETSEAAERQEEEELYSRLPPELMSNYTNQEEEPLVFSPSIQGMRVQFEMRQSDLGQAWFHMRANRAAAERLLTGRAQGSFLVRPSSQRGCYALSYVTASRKVKHDIIYSRYPGFSMADRGGVVHRSLSALIDDVGLVQRELMVVEHEAADADSDLVAILNESNMHLVECVRKLLMKSEERMKELSWTLSVQEPAGAGGAATAGGGWAMRAVDLRQCEKRTVVNHCFSEYVAPDLLRLAGSSAERVFRALAKNTSLEGLTVRGYCSQSMSRLFESNLFDGDVLFLARSLVSNTCLVAIDLSTNKIGDKGAAFLAAALKHNKTVRKLVLDRNFIHFEGIRQLALALHTNHTLDHLSLASQLTEDGISGARVLNNDRRAQSLVHQITAVLRRKEELVGAAMCKIGFQGFQTRKDMERKLAHEKAGSYVFYLDKNVANCLFVAYVSPVGTPRRGRGDEEVTAPESPTQSRAHLRSRSTESFSKRLPIVHRPVYRHVTGYSLERPSDAVPSLVSACCWTIASLPAKRRPQEASALPAKLQAAFEEVAKLVTLWGIHAEDTLDGDGGLPSSSTYPTLRDMMAASKRWMRR